MNSEDRAGLRESKSFKDRLCELPLCSILLVSLTITCHSLVLAGNFATADVLTHIGASTGGWSDVGLGVSSSMVNEVQTLMGQTSSVLAKALNESITIESEINMVLGASGNSTEDAISSLRALSTDGDKTAASTVGMASVSTDGNKPDAIRKAAKQKAMALAKGLNTLISGFWDLIKPALVQVGQWLETMGTKMQGFIEQFGTTIDKAQKIFDQIMAKLSGADDIKNQLIYDTFAIFDITHVGAISKDDIQQVASLYGVTALVGSKGDDLHKKYDADGDGGLSNDEYSLFVDDESIPSVMTYVLRTFSKKLSQVAGKMKGSKMRDEVAETVVEYFELMVAKNLTKVRWVAQTLTNGSLPLEFTADVFRNLVLMERSPERLTNIPVGQTIISEMVDLNPSAVAKAVKLCADPDFWATQGFQPANQPIVVGQINEWVSSASKPPTDAPPADGVEVALLSTSASQKRKALVDELAHLTSETISKRMRHHQHLKRQDRIRQHQQVFYAASTQHLYRHLLGQSGSNSVVGAAGDPDVDRVVQGGVPAKPETLQFALFLVNNATRTSQQFQNNSFDYAKTSSNPIDNFASQIQSFIKKVQQFLSLMMSYSTERGINDLEQKVFSFIDESEADLTKLMDHLIDVSLENTTTPVSLLSLGSRPEVSSGLGLSGVWTSVADVITALKGILPTVVDDIKFAQKEVSQVSNTLKSVFEVFKDKGSPLFNTISSLYKTIWIVYYVLFVMLTMLILFYAFWAQGYFGGPIGDDAPKAQTGTFRERCGRCCDSCLVCMRGIQDGHICFWSCILLSEVVILIMFVVAILLTILAGLKAFVAGGCAQIYVLGDDSVCTSVMTGLRGWMVTFWSDMPSNIADACNVRQLTTCQAVADEMKSSIMHTVVGSFAAAMFSIQLLFLSAQLHERAVWNNKLKAARESKTS